MRQSLDDKVSALLKRADGSLTAADVVDATGVNAVAATHCLQRLVRAGVATVTADTVQTDGRVSEIVLHYQVAPKKSMGLPAWLDPRRLPDAVVVTVRRHSLPMTECECEAV